MTELEPWKKIAGGLQDQLEDVTAERDAALAFIEEAEARWTP